MALTTRLWQSRATTQEIWHAAIVDAAEGRLYGQKGGSPWEPEGEMELLGRMSS